MAKSDNERAANLGQRLADILKNFYVGAGKYRTRIVFSLTAENETAKQIDVARAQIEELMDYSADDALVCIFLLGVEYANQIGAEGIVARRKHLEAMEKVDHPFSSENLDLGSLNKEFGG